MLLAQINLEQIAAEAPLPRQGMLQFFTALNDEYGLNFDKPDQQDTFRVVYHEAIDYTVTKEQLEGLSIPVNTDEENGDYSPVIGELAVEAKKQEIAMGTHDYRYAKLFGQLAREEHEEDKTEACGNWDEEEEECINQGHWLLGYPYFTQSDPRECEKQYQYYDTLLFQMDSDSVDGEYCVMWGDCGVCNFFINRKDLENREFGRILYNWDCC